MEKNEKKIFCVVPHTHWDREWYLPLELFRLRLVDLIDHCLELLSREPRFLFHLDAQTVVLEDYLTFRPERREELERRIREGRLLVGPWYLQNDFYLTSGEATVRNLLLGASLARAFGGDCRLGYAPDQFGNISQLPQILRGFGIDHFIFGRGAAEGCPGEFVWEGADGTRALAIYLAFWYNNAQRFSEDPARAVKLVEKVEREYDGVAATPYLLMMNGVDHLEAQENLLEILDRVRPLLGGEREIRLCALPDYVASVKRSLAAHAVQLPVYKGELRGGADGKILKGTLSSRVYLKQENARAQARLEGQLEPLYALLELSGARGVTAAGTFRYLWKKLLRNHPHDSICGCARDEAHRRMEESYASLRRTTDELLRRGLLLALEHMDDGGAPDEYRVVVANTLPMPRAGVITCTVDLPGEGDGGFELIGADGEKAQFEVLSCEAAQRGVFSPVNLPTYLPVRRCAVRFFEKGIAGYAFKSYRLRLCGAPLTLTRQGTYTARRGGVTIENECLRVTVSDAGQIELTVKASGRRIPCLLEVEEIADRGDSYIFRGDGEAIYGERFPAVVSRVESGGLTQTVRVSRALVVPAAYDFGVRARCAETVRCELTLELTLQPGNPMVEVGYRLDNRARDHRVRLLVGTDIDSDRATADLPFDVLTREDDAHDPRTRSRVWPNSSFALLEGEGRGLAVLTEGQQEFEHLPARRALAFTIVRGTGVIGRDTKTGLAQGEQFESPENQCLRRLCGRMAIFPYEGGWAASGVAERAQAFRNPLLTLFSAVDARKFSGGRMAVQETDLQELFYVPDRYPAMRIASNKPALSVTGRGIQATALKKAENGEGHVLRLVNLTDAPQTARIETTCRLFAADLEENAGETLENGCVALRPKEIKTLLLK